MKRLLILFALTAVLAAFLPAQTPAQPALHGVVTDPSGALVPGALVQIRGPAGEQRKTTDVAGQYAFPALPPGKYLARFIAKGFSVTEKRDLEITGPLALDVQLAIQPETQVVNVEDEANRVSADPASNGGALILREKELEALSDDPDELAQELQAMAGPAAGPSGGQIYIDGFTGGQLPSKSSIREIRINANPFAPEFDRPGFGRIEILTKAGSDKFHGQVFGQFNKEALNSRSALLTQPKRPPYKQELYGVSLSGPLKTRKASFGFDAQRRTTTENAFVLATVLDGSLNPQTVNQAVLTPQTFLSATPRLDYAVNPKHNLTVRYQDTRSERDKQGVGDFSLPSRAYNSKLSESTLQITETAMPNPRFINETRLQYMHMHTGNIGDISVPGLVVQGAFTDGSSQIGDSGSTSNRWELTNTSTFIHKTHTIKWGARLRQTFDASTSMSNFGGTYTFAAGVGPQLDAGNQPVAGTSLQLSALEVYRRTLLFQGAGLTDAQIRLLGGGAYEFSLAAGIPTTSVSQFDIGLFVNDDWRPRSNLTFSYGMRYEAQTNIGNFGAIGPRFGLAWGIDAKGSKPAKTILRAGVGAFYDRVSDSLLLQSIRFNGVTQQSYVIFNPSFFPTIPPSALLQAARLPQQLQIVDSAIRAPINYQANLGVDRMVKQYFRLSINYIGSRGVHLQRSRDINAPLNGLYPFGDPMLRNLTETTGFSRTNILTVTPSVTYKKVILFGYYALIYAKTDAEGQPANPYNLRAEWGPSSSVDVRHNLVLGVTDTLPLKISVSPFMILRTGSPYNITTGQDINHDGYFAERPALLTGIGPAGCSAPGLIFEPAFGCFSLNPAAGTPAIERDFARGPGNISTVLRLARTWSLGGKGDAANTGGATATAVRSRAAAQAAAIGVPAGMYGSGGGGSKYNLTLSLTAMNPLNHTNYAPPSGDLSSPYFGVYRSLSNLLGGSNTYNRKIDVLLRLTF
jgi:hypothetical protein